jgi:hypothetical protein
VVGQILEVNVLMMDGGAPPAHAGGANPPAGQLRAGNINGPIQVNVPNNQNYQYLPNGINQPLLGNIARSLHHKANIGLSSLSHYTFTPSQ